MSSLTSVCYHYIARADQFRRIWGHGFELFKKHLDFYKKNYKFVSAEDIKNKNLDGNCLLLTFDDGLKEHSKIIAPYLESLGIKAVFSVPSCILVDEPNTPQIIHFGTAYYGVRKFYSFVEEELMKYYPNRINFLAKDSKALELMDLHKLTKNIFKRQLPHAETREILLNIYNQKIKKDFPDFMERVHLNKEDIVSLAKRGHTIAVHTHTHPAVKDIFDDKEMFEQEVIRPKKVLTELINKGVDSFAYPFGAKEDVLADLEILSKIGYNLVFTTYQTGKQLNLLDIGRYCSQSQDSTVDLKNNLWSYQVK